MERSKSFWAAVVLLWALFAIFVGPVGPASAASVALPDAGGSWSGAEGIAGSR